MFARVLIICDFLVHSVCDEIFNDLSSFLMACLSRALVGNRERTSLYEKRNTTHVQSYTLPGIVEQT